MKDLKRKVIDDIIEWDTENWGVSLAFWEKHFPILNQKKLSCLELGGRSGGPSLWLALKGHDVLCTDLQNPEEKASQLHQKYNYSGTIEYAAVDALNIAYENKFDVVISKSIIGGVSRSGNDQNKQKVVDEIFKALKPGGVFLMAENMIGSKFHQIAREKFVRWGNEWNYFSTDQIALLNQFENINWTTQGFLGSFGRNEYQRQALGKLDHVFQPMIPSDQRYILIICAQKPQ